MSITHVFFDIGGVLGSNGWDREQRAQAAAHFGLDAEFDKRHYQVVGEWESGRMSLDEYLDTTVFGEPRPYSRDEFVDFMRSLSVPNEAAIDVVRALDAAGRARLYTLNNEAETLNQHRIAAFGLRPLFLGFLSSCWLGVRQPARLIFERALGVTQAVPAASLFVDDREQNLEPARQLGFATHLFAGPDALRDVLASHGLL